MIRAVIGAQFGDEGKGLMVDYLSDHLTLVVRHNGGAQAGHTVTCPDGRRHSFGHLGAGCFKAACTLLSRHFIVNPVLFRAEFEAPALRGVRRTVYVDPRARVTTPWDMMLNVAAERRRGAARHGSCGAGINETVERCLGGVALGAGELGLPRGALAQKLRAIREDYVRRRAAALDVVLPPEAWGMDLLCRFMDDCDFLRERVEVEDDAALIAGTRDVVFEGAQGLRLDERAPGFPHVTRSRTGLPNAMALLREAGRDREPVFAHYVTRCYVTRHGAGPLPGELPGHPWGWAGEEANVFNEHQGAFRYAPLDGGDLMAAIQRDYAEATDWEADVRLSLVVTCLDQSGARFGVAEAEALADFAGIPLAATTHGPTRADVAALVLA